MAVGGTAFGLLFIVMAIGMVLLLIGVLWVLPIILGVRCAQRKNYSPLWMLFGIHPIGGWVAFIVLSCLPGRTQCGRCGGFLSKNWRICPFCQTPVAAMGMPYPPTATQPPPPPQA